MIHSADDDAPYEAAIAIIGMAGRFPGAPDVGAFWQNIAAGVRSIRSFSDAELLAAGVDPALLQQPNYVKAGATLDDIESFDAAFFGYPPREAEVIDPQHRLFLECAWEALEHAAYNPETYPGLIGVFAGASASTYAHYHVLTRADVLKSMGMLVVAMNNEPDSLASTVSYKLNLRGPSVAVQTFCSTSLVAVHMACRSLLTYECDIALAGGVMLAVPHCSGYLYQEGGIVSPDGRVRTFDANAKGSVMGNGLGIVVLKRMEEALADGDQIYAVIRGSAVNNDGIRKVGYTAPGLAGQTAVILSALMNANVPPETISYVEAHGTATPLGDSVELAAMINAFRSSTPDQQFCAIGSAKPNIGHLDRASGVTGLIKTSLALHHKLLPPSIEFESADPELDLPNSPFYVNTSARAWPRNGTPRRAGVSSFGLGGTNAHVVLEETPARTPSSAALPHQLLLLSAKTESALDAATANLAAFLRRHPNANLADVAYTLQVGRSVFNHRRMLVARDREDAIAALEQSDSKRVLTVNQTGRERPVAFLLAGVGDHYARMAQELYQAEPSFRATVDRCCALLQPHLGLDLREVLYPEEQRTKNKEQIAQNQEPRTENRRPTTENTGLKIEDSSADASRQLSSILYPRSSKDKPSAILHPRYSILDQTEYAQPAVFVVEYALAQLLIGWGVRPAALLGYSVGEYAAACLSGVLSLEDALKLVAIRARLIASQPQGAMLAVMSSEVQVQPFLREGVELAIVNGPQSCVLAGSPAAIDALAVQLAQHEIACRAVPASHAFHTSLLAPIANELTALVRTIKLHPPAIPYLSNVTGTWITAEQATDPAYWARHMVEMVRFADGVATLLATPEQVLLEIGAGQALSSFVKGHPQCPRARFGQVIATLPGAQERSSERAGLLAALGKLWLADVPIDWGQVHAEERRERLALPTYPFERQRFWIEPAARKAEESTGDFGAMSNEQERKPDIADWFYLPSWKRSSPTRALASTNSFAERRNWVLLVDQCGIGVQLARWLTEHGQTAITVTVGPAFAQQSEHTYTVRPTMRADFETLLETLEALNLLPRQVIHMWSVTPPTSPVETVEAITPLLERGFYSLLALTQALGNQGLDTCQISVVANELHDVNGAEVICPAKTTLIGICKVVSQEYTGLTGRSIDIVLPANTGDARALAEQIAQEIAGAHQDNIVALRGPHRWVEAFEPVRIEQDQHNLALRKHGVYVITGGLGGLGLALAEELVAKQQARLVLLGRTPLPPRTQWPHILATHDLTSGVGRRVRIVSDLEARGAEVLVLQADVADVAQVRAAVRQAMSHFGTIHGVFHTAGVPAVGIIQLKDARSGCRRVGAQGPGHAGAGRSAARHPAGLPGVVLFGRGRDERWTRPGRLLRRQHLPGRLRPQQRTYTW